jgi:hypothetical protein
MDINLGSGGGGSGAWFGVLTTIGGVVAGSLGTWLVQTGQRRFDASQRDIDRKGTLRKDVYLRATETMTDALTTLVNLGQGQEEAWNKARPAFLATLQQLQLVGSEKTVVAANQMNRLFSQAALEITLAAMPVNAAKKAVGEAEAGFHQSRAKLDALTEELKDLASDGAAVAARVRVFERVKAQQVVVTAAVQQWQRASSEYQAIAKTFVSGLVGPLGPVNDKALELINLIREDLGHPPLGKATRLELLANADALRRNVIDLGNAPDAASLSPEST